MKKYNDYIYSFNTGDLFKAYQVSIRINLTSEINPDEIFNLLLNDAVRVARLQGEGVVTSNINFNFITLVYSHGN